MSTHLKKSVNEAHLEIGIYEQAVTLCYSWIIWKPSMSYRLTRWAGGPLNRTPNNRNQHATTVLNHTITKAMPQLQNLQKRPRTQKTVLEITTVHPKTQSSIQKNNNYNNNNKNYRKPRNLNPLRDTCGKTNNSTVRCYVQGNALSRPLPRKSKLGGQIEPRKQNAQSNLTDCGLAATQSLILKCHVITPEL